MTPPLTSDKRRQVQTKIFRAALREFSLNGLQGTSTQAIAKAAGLSKPTLFYYITSKEHLYEEIVTSIVAKWESLFFDIDQRDDPKAVISRYIETKILYALEHPMETRFFSQEVARGAPVLRRHWEQSKDATARACEVIESWISMGKIKPVDPMVFQMELWAVTQHYADYEAQAKFFLGVENDAAFDANRLIRQAQTLFLRGMGLEVEEPAA
ncbi:TetR family transcriptional regulator C-terminal domain-containing protein [Sulfitobacter sp. F26169L]|uniref:TetR family transcriptional regulator C-terminal domain-containing protein n=1 Tax=Sulfitobacter sp. F26169L TaxID=2996015 RepID=UPI002260DF9A|nr:TetR family transcriptional regulator C-terminal domain-containing protein [Sulfitobacter sp. F26169L]MCX7568116.1 TetR family transcriptional regulator C-terminal domain-containing protein [Sulfitobacter sp. F26169L]